MELVCGVDESGRGCLAGPLVAAAVILDPKHPIEGLADSKKLHAKKREHLSEVIRTNALAFAIAQASVDEIDTLNILRAAFLAMQRAVNGLGIIPSLALIDGNMTPQLSMPAKAIIKGDVHEPVISAASILAKVERDRIILGYHETMPWYRFDLHKSYGTKLHLELLQEYGPSPIHRKSFGPVAAFYT
ncbi:MAG TPA: ribonuclease HII [Burkholderiales bacterium]|nr:ribonuclease HII [Burkholderiales bacterium]